jgi:hypothetical protein
MAFVIRDKPIHLDEAQFALQLAAEIEHIKSLNEDIAVVTVIDTVARSMSGKSPENGEGLMSFANNLLDYVVRPLGCACIAVHHSGHGDKTRGRGSSAFPAALDGSILVEIERKGSETFVNVNAQEMRATSGGDSFQFLIETQPIKGVDNFGNQISEPVLLFVGDCVANDFDKESKIPQCGIKALIILKGMYERYKKNLGEDSDKALVSERDWRQEYYDSIGEGTKTDTKRKAFTRAVDALLERGAVVRDGVFVRLTGE